MVTTTIGQRWLPYAYADYSAAIPADGEAMVLSGVTNFESPRVMVVGNGSMTVAQLVAMRQTRPIYTYADVSTQIPEAGVAVAIASAPVTTLHIIQIIGDGAHTIAELISNYNENLVSAAGGLAESLFLPYVPTSEQLVLMTAIAFGRGVGSWNFSDITQTPVTCAESMSASNPTGLLYCPCIPRGDANHDISTTEVPQWVIDKFNNEVVTIDGVSSFQATVNNGVWTFADATAPNKVLALYQASCMVNQWHASGESATYAASGALYTGARQYALTANGVNYGITAISPTGHTMTTATYPENGTYTVTFGPTRVAGYTTKARLRKVSGFVPVVAGDASGEVAIMMDAMDRFMDHWHKEYNHYAGSFTGFIGSAIANDIVDNISTKSVREAVAPPEGGAPRTGKTTNPRTHGVDASTHVAVLLAKTWTSA